MTGFISLCKFDTQKKIIEHLKRHLSLNSLADGQSNHSISFHI